MILVQVLFALKARRDGERPASQRKQIKREAWGHTVFRVIRSILLVGFLVLYALNSPSIMMLSVGAPDWLRWIGVALGAISIAFYAWSRATLGKAWSSELRTGENHYLVTTGPYAHIRHPIYLALMGFLTGTALIASNFLFFAVALASVLDLGFRIPKEELMMTERFGEQYKAYVRKTGRLLPK